MRDRRTSRPQLRKRIALFGGAVMFRRFAFVIGVVTFAGPAFATDIVKGSKPVAVIVCDSKPGPAPKGGKKQAGTANEAVAAKLLVDWVKKITDAELPVVDKAGDGIIPIYIGKAAVRAGLKLDDIDSPSHEGVRIIV